MATNNYKSVVKSVDNVGNKHVNSLQELRTKAALAELKREEKEKEEQNRTPAHSSFDISKTAQLINDAADARIKQAQEQIDYAAAQGEAELSRNLEDAKLQFQTQRDQVDADEARALDNQALYSELRGDFGGIGKAQYGSIQNTAAKNRLYVSQAQTKLATDTARQIADLRAQGEFDKADAALSVAQERLSQLVELEKWAAQFGLSERKFLEELKQWEAKFEQEKTESYADLTGMLPDGSLTLKGKEEAVSLIKSMVSMGVIPTVSQLTDAYGMDEYQAKNYIEAMKLKSAAKDSSGKTSGGTGKDTAVSGETVYDEIFGLGITTLGGAYDYLLNKKGYGVTAANKLSQYYMEWYKDKQNAADNENAATERDFEQYLHMAVTLLNDAQKAWLIMNLENEGKISKNQMRDIARRVGISLEL